MIRILIAASAMLLTAACATTLSLQQMEADKAAIINVLNTQDAAWNRGDIDGFMVGYLDSEDLRFASGGTVTRGFNATLQRYKTNYADRAKMGTLSFTDLEVDQVSPDAAVVYGRWRLDRAADTPGGLFTLIFRKVDGDWVVVSDTTTSAN